MDNELAAVVPCRTARSITSVWHRGSCSRYGSSLARESRTNNNIKWHGQRIPPLLIVLIGLLPTSNKERNNGWTGIQSWRIFWNSKWIDNSKQVIIADCNLELINCEGNGGGRGLLICIAISGLNRPLKSFWIKARAIGNGLGCFCVHLQLL